MSPQEALAAARASGVEVRLDGKDLIVSSAGEPPDDICTMLSGQKAAILEYLQAVPAERASCPPNTPPPPPAPVPVRPWSAADWRVFHNKRQLVAEVALGQTRGQARVYAFVRCVEEWRRVRPGSPEEQAITALAEKGIVHPSPPPPARHKATVVEHLRASGTKHDLPLASAGVVGAGADVTSPADITCPQRPQGDEWQTEDWLAFYGERAAIAEYDGKLDRPAAEALALRYCIGEWLDRNPAASSVSDGCPVCGDGDRLGDDLLPVGLGAGEERTWLHRDCVPAWRAARMAEAVAALAAMGITSKGSSP
jgi:hypothetical protein